MALGEIRAVAVINCIISQSRTGRGWLIGHRQPNPWVVWLQRSNIEEQS